MYKEIVIEKYKLIATDEPYYAHKAKENDLPLIIYDKNLCPNNMPSCECIIDDLSLLSDNDFVLKMCQRHFHIPWTIYESDTICIRELCMEDASHHLDILKELDEMSNDYPMFSDLNMLKAYISSMYELCGFGLWLIVKEQEAIGLVGFSLPDDFDSPSLGYAILPSYRQQGYAYEASKAAIDYGFRELAFDKIYCHIRSGNAPSINLAQKLGFNLTTTEGSAFLSGFLERR